jgi:hypothetical protein
VTVPSSLAQKRSAAAATTGTGASLTGFAIAPPPAKSGNTSFYINMCQLLSY